MTTAQILLIYFLEIFNQTGIAPNAPTINYDEVYCLAKNIYFEARGEGIQGQRAVALVTLNRVKDERYPDTVCDVVHQSAKVRRTQRTVCAFSWVCDSDKKTIPVVGRDGTIDDRTLDEFQTATRIAVNVMNGRVKDVTRGATHFFNPKKASPKWQHTLSPTIKLGNHNFYK
jgi:spore germination cell wall hydrolase CwlJ-like protein